LVAKARKFPRSLNAVALNGHMPGIVLLDILKRIDYHCEQRDTFSHRSKQSPLRHENNAGRQKALSPYDPSRIYS
jgi:hypothetical protein